jgi:hypothetical protein
MNRNFTAIALIFSFCLVAASATFGQDKPTIEALLQRQIRVQRKLIREQREQIREQTAAIQVQQKAAEMQNATIRGEQELAAQQSATIHDQLMAANTNRETTQRIRSILIATAGVFIVCAIAIFGGIIVFLRQPRNKENPPDNDEAEFSPNHTEEEMKLLLTENFRKTGSDEIAFDLFDEGLIFKCAAIGIFKDKRCVGVCGVGFFEDPNQVLVDWGERMTFARENKQFAEAMHSEESRRN